jgi:hypothetical protein
MINRKKTNNEKGLYIEIKQDEAGIPTHITAGIPTDGE